MATDWLFSLFLFVMAYVVPVAGLGFLYYLYQGDGEIRYLSSWGDLEKDFAVTAIPSNYQITSGRLGMWHFQGTLKVAFDQTGVFIDVPDLFRFGKKPLYIPFGEFAITTKFPLLKFGFSRYSVFIVRQQLIWLATDEANIILAHQATHS